MQSRRAGRLSGKWDKKDLPILDLYRQALSAASDRFSPSRFSFSYIIDISLIILKLSVNDQFGYQYPKLGFLHFYKKGKLLRPDFEMYQCPNSGFPHFYDVPVVYRYTHEVKVSMP